MSITKSPASYLILFLFLVLSGLAACGGEPEQPAPAPVEQAREGALARVKRTGKLVAGVSGDLPLFGFRRAGVDEPEGFEVDIVRALAEDMGVDLELVVLLPSERLSAAASGRVDLVAAGLAHTFQREEAVDFSLPTFMDGQKLLVHKASGIKGLADLPGRAAAAAKGAGDATRLKEAVPGAEVRAYDDYIKAFLALKRGEAQALTADATVLLKLRAADVDPKLWEIAGPFLSRKPYAIALPEDQSDLRDAVNRALARLWISGDYRRIYEKWFGPDTGYSLPLNFEMQVWPGAEE